MRHGIMRCDAGTWGGRTEFVRPISIMPPFVLLLGRQAVFTHVVFHGTCILLLRTALDIEVHDVHLRHFQ